MKNKWQGVSLLFPMEKLFEAYIGRILTEQLVNQYHLKEQISSRYLTQHQDKKWFQLRPDFAIYQNNSIEYILDAKWKLLDTSKNKYGLSQGDFYQLYSYGQKYLLGSGELFLIYPLHKKFDQPLAEFLFSEELRLWIVPFDLTEDKLLVPERFNFLFNEGVVQSHAFDLDLDLDLYAPK